MKTFIKTHFITPLSWNEYIMFCNLHLHFREGIPCMSVSEKIKNTTMAYNIKPCGLKLSLFKKKETT